MFTSERALRAAGTRGEPLPHLPELEAMYRYGFEPRRGQMMMIAGQSGAAKTFFALWLVLKWGLRTLYCSQDSDAHTMTARQVAALSGMTVDTASGYILNDPDYVAPYVENSNIRYTFDQLTVESLWHELDAGLEVEDRYPEVIVIDNLSDLDVGDESYQARLYGMQELHRLRLTGALVIVLHHTRSNPGGKNNWSTNDPQPRWEIDNKLDRKPELILTTAIDVPNRRYSISKVKDRSGPSTPDASVRFHLGMDLSRCLFYKAA